ncbi:hypothetical protein Asp14428_64090 [Actinoplanes sp. NBRC 14428]|uniref:Uncharacterized protein n=1 Tax=Pseudosporangium ferrugineum TaxID=439699 RepID=A0A2T0RU48_9ACTN|nr:hypothetical protein [Pseudosporangium ferrugineum]PRY24684.1 hypothetical protein CLV70_113122 [Pseudosporangium ferrugineum]BCJ54934.1 hypothetical protein Asp14428_64090 [Actinoplanes sp. NBRC 14428]
MRSLFARRPLTGALVLAAATVLTWLVFLGGDTEKDVDPVTLVESGPYTVPQVAGCLLTLVVLLVLAVVAGVPRWYAAAAMTLAFSLAWTVQAAMADDSGLFVIGGVLVALGMAAGTVVVAVATDAVLRPRG